MGYPHGGKRGLSRGWSVMENMDLLGPMAIIISLMFGMGIEGVKSYRRNKKILRHKRFVAQKGL